MANGVLGTPPPPQGLLGKISSGIQGAVNNPLVQGLGAAAAFGFNPLLGLLAVPGLQGDRQRASMQNEFARERLRKLRQQRKASGNLDELINSLATPQAQPLAPGEMGPPEAGAARLNPEQAAFLRTAGRFDPAAALQGVGGVLGFGQEEKEPRLPTDVQALVATDPNALQDPEIQAALRDRVINPGGDVQTQLDATRALIQKLELEQKAGQLARDAKERQRDEARVRHSIKGDMKRAREALDLQQDLAQSALSTGVPYGDFWSELQAGGASIAQNFGIESSEARELVAKRDRLKKLFSSNIIQSIPTLGELGGLTNDKLSLVEASAPSLDNQPEANALLFADQLELALQGADIADIGLDDREEIEALIKEIRETTFSSSGDNVRILNVRRKGP